jgi:Fe-S cluster assembly scaffold protein SufB
MNKILIEKNDVLKIKDNSNLFVNIDEMKDIIIGDSCNVVINLIESRNKVKGDYNITINNNSTLTIIRGCLLTGVEENVKIMLKGVNSKIEYKLVSFIKGDALYNIECHHLNHNTISNIVCNGVSVKDYSLKFNIIGEVEKGIKGCNINQSSKIRTFGDGKCEANPILKIGEMDTIAHHATNIGRFSDEELYYLKSRGLSHNEAVKLLIGGFFNEIINNLNEELRVKFLSLMDSEVKEFEH